MILSTGGCLLSGGACSRGGVPAPGGCLVETPPRMATAAGGTHPTGMHSCYELSYSFVSRNPCTYATSKYIQRRWRKIAHCKRYSLGTDFLTLS